MPQNNSNGQDPWGRRPNDGPPDLLAMLKRWLGNKKTSSTSGSGGGGGAEIKASYIYIIIAAVVLIWAVSGIFLVSPQEQGVVLRFGRYVATVGPGPHWIPRFIDSARIVNVQQISNFKYQSEMLTQDENIVSVSLAVQYRIDNPRDYLYNVVNPELTLRQATSSALRQVVGQMTLDSILTTGRVGLSQKVDKLLAEVMSQYHAGLQIRDVTLQPAKPPEAVIHAFDDVIKAREDGQTFKNQAQAYNSEKIAIVKGSVARIMQNAKAYTQQVVLNAKGTTARYLALLKPYKAAPEVTRERLYLDAMQNVLSKTSNVVLDTKGSNNVLYLPLDQIMKSRAMSSTAGAQQASMAADNDRSSSGSVVPAQTSSSDGQSSYLQSRSGYTGVGS